MAFTRLTALFAVAALAAGASAATLEDRTSGWGLPANGASSSCSKSEFSFKRGGKSCCLPQTPPAAPPAPPADHECPKKYYWHSGQTICVPDHPIPDDDDEEPDCPSNCSWNKGGQYCQPHSPPTAPSAPPKPSSPPTSPVGGGNTCSKDEFHFKRGSKSCCLPQKPPAAPPAPPADHQCPKSYYWHSGQTCCVPDHPIPDDDDSEPECPSNCSWNKGDQYCQPHSPPAPSPPQPSKAYGNHGHNYKRTLKSRAASLCPSGLEACPIQGLSAGEYECLDVKVELESCGGCASVGQGQDCTAIEGAWNVGCDAGTCAVYTCQTGFTRSSDGKSCIAL